MVLQSLLNADKNYVKNSSKNRSIQNEKNYKITGNFLKQQL